MTTTDNPVSQADKNDGQQEWSRIVHVLLSHGPDRRESNKAEYKENVDNGDKIDRNSPATKLKWAVSRVSSSKLSYQHEQDWNQI